jgi:adenine-specific DNA-methyltransferase
MKQLFPEAVSEGKVDFVSLRQLLGDAKVLDEGEEKYGLNWHGKKKARQIALTPSTGTLLPCPEESVDWDTTQNLFIEGDNLEVLKILQRSYSNKVKMIYIDPPYNTEKDFIYPDNFTEGLDAYLKYTGQKDKQGWRVSQSAQEKTGRKHTNWLNMMSSRLNLSRSLLMEQGVIFLSINDKEVSQLKSLMNEIYGEKNFLATLIWDKNHSAQAGIFKTYHEYILVYAKNIDHICTPKSESAELFGAGAMKRESRRHPISEFTFPAGVRFMAEDGFELSGSWGGAERVQLISGEMRCVNQLTTNEVTLKAGWTQKDQMEQYFYGDRESVTDTRGQRVVEFYFTGSGKIKIVKERGVEAPQTTLKNYGTQGAISTELAELFSLNESPLENPKPWRMIKDFISWFTEDGDIVLDFFAGSCTTAHAVFEKNFIDNGSRRFIVVQLPEKVSEWTTPNTAGFNTISELGAKRIILAAEKIKKEEPNAKLDLGFQKYTLAGSCIRAWEPDLGDLGDLEASLLLNEEHLIEGRSEKDILYELLLKRGLDLAVPIESREVVGKNIYSIGYGALFACLDESITMDQVEEIAHGIITWHGELVRQENEDKNTHVFFRDSAFHNDISKTNMVAILEQNGIAHVRSL